MKASGWTGVEGMAASLAVAAVVCTAAASAGDISQDLKASYLLGATPWASTGSTDYRNRSVGLCDRFCAHSAKRSLGLWQ